MRILLSSNAPWAPTGYGQQTALWALRLKSLGHEVAIAAFYGLDGARTTWNGIPVYPGGFDGTGGDVLEGHARHFKADLVIILADAFAQNPQVLSRLKAAVWGPVDCDPLGGPDRELLEASQARPIAMSRFGERMLTDAGLVPFYVPHGIDTQVFKPGDKAAYRKTLGLPQDAFIIGMNAANKDRARKGFPEQMAAFAGLHAAHPDTLLLIHSTPQACVSGGVNLTSIAKNLGIQDAIRWADPYSYAAGAYTAADMVAWYGCLDLYSGCSYAEGFGLPLIEAQACGIPVVTTDASAMSELAGPGWKVGGEPHWHEGHCAWWTKPYVGEIAAAYLDAYDGGAQERRDAAREFAAGYDADLVLTKYWKPVLEELEAEAGSGDWHRIMRHSGFRWLVDNANACGDVLGLGHEEYLDPQVLGLLPEGGVFLDVGAHVGHYTLRASRKASRVIAVEASPETAQRLERNLALNGISNVTVHNVAAWDKRTKLSLHSPNGYERDGSTRVQPGGGGPATTAVPLDDLLAGEDRIDAVKLDVEGADLHALRGMRKTLARCRPALFIEDHSIYGYYQRAALDKLLAGLGYTWRDLPAYRGYVIAQHEGENDGA
jgi:FkbM family methyltransferase